MNPFRSFIAILERRFKGPSGPVVIKKISPRLNRGWQDPKIPPRQYQAFAPLLEEMRAGAPREDFLALAEAVRSTGLENPLLIEVGSSSGWNSEVLTHLLKRPPRYVGLDYSEAMTAFGKKIFPRARFVVGEATRLPFHNQSCDILISGGVLMHLAGYEEAIRESRRVTRRWCIFHTIPIVRKRPTTFLRKFAYGRAVVEVAFNEREFLSLIENHGLVVCELFPNIPHEYLNPILQEPVSAWTYLCETR